MKSKKNAYLLSIALRDMNCPPLNLNEIVLDTLWDDSLNHSVSDIPTRLFVCNHKALVQQGNSYSFANHRIVLEDI